MFRVVSAVYGGDKGGKGGPGCIISPSIGAPRATFITMWLLKMTFWLPEGHGDMTFDKGTWQGGGSCGLMLGVELKGGKNCMVQYVEGGLQELWVQWNIWPTIKEAISACTILWSLLWIRSTISILRCYKCQSGDTLRLSGWEILQMSFLYLYIGWKPWLGVPLMDKLPDVSEMQHRDRLTVGPCLNIDGNLAHKLRAYLCS